MSNRFLGYFFLVIFVSCSSKDKTPSNIIQPERMKNIIWDVMRAHALAVEITKKDSSVNERAETKALTQKVFAIHKIKAADFNKSYNWYIKHPDAMSIIFDTLYAQKQAKEFIPKVSILKDTIRKNTFYEMTHKNYWTIDTIFK